MALFPGEELVPVDTPSGQVMLPRSVAGTLALNTNASAPAEKSAYFFNNDREGHTFDPNASVAEQRRAFDEYNLDAPVEGTGKTLRQLEAEGRGDLAAINRVGKPSAGASGNALAGVPSVADLEKLPPPQAPPTIEHEQGNATAPTGPTLAPVDFSAPAGAPAPAPKSGPAQKGIPGAAPTDPLDVAQSRFDAAAEKGAEAERDIAAAKSAGALDAAQAYKAAAADQQRIMDDYRRSHVETQAKIAEANDFIKKNTQKIADAKIDRTHDHETMAFIGIALTGLGNALAGKGDAANPAIDLYFKSIDRKVKAQMDELDKTGKIVGLTQQQVDNLRKELGDSKQMADFLLTAQTQRHANILNQIAQTTTSDVVKAEAEKYSAMLWQKSAEMGANIAFKKVERETAREQMATQLKSTQIGASATLGAASMHLQGTRESIASNERIHEEQNKVAMANKIAELRAKGESEKAAQLAKAHEENVKGAVGLIGTGTKIYNQDGQDKLDQATQLESEAAALDKSAQATTSPFKIDVGGGDGQIGPKLPSQTPQGKAAMMGARAQALRQKAADLRVAAETTGVWRIDNPETKREVINKYTAANNISRTTADLLRKYDEGGGKSWYKTNEDQAVVQTMIVELLMAQKEAWRLGVLSAGEITQLQKAGLKDPTKAWDEDAVGNVAHAIGLNAGRNPEAFKKQLLELASRNEKDTQTLFQAHGYTGDVKKLFVNYNPAADTPARKAQRALGGIDTVEQQQSGDETSTLQKIGKGLVAGVALPIAGAVGAVGGYAASESGSAKPEVKWGLDKDGVKAVETLIKEYQAPSGKTPAEKAQTKKEAEDFIRNVVVVDPTSGNSAKALSVMRALREKDPELYARLLPEVSAVDPAYVPGGLAADDRARKTADSMKANALKETAAAARGGDQQAYADLQKEAATNAAARTELAKVNEALAISKITPSRKPDYSPLPDPFADRSRIVFPPSKRSK